MSRFETDLDVRFHRGEIGGWLLAPLVFVSSDFGRIVVPQRFYTDFASVPGQILLPGIVPKIGKVRDAAIVHDYLYSINGELPDGRKLTRKECDSVFYDALLVCRVPVWRAKAAYAGVRAGGWKAWLGHKCAKTPPSIQPAYCRSLFGREQNRKAMQDKVNRASYGDQPPSNRKLQLIHNEFPDE